MMLLVNPYYKNWVKNCVTLTTFLRVKNGKIVKPYYKNLAKKLEKIVKPILCEQVFAGIEGGC